MIPVAATPVIALLGEARGEFLFLRMVAEEIRARYGPDAALQIEMDPTDLTDAERRGCVVPATRPEFVSAARIRAADLPDRIAEAEHHHGVDNLRRLWRGDIQFWRDGVPEDQLARQALGYLAVFDALYREHPGLRGGFAEESGRLMKRAFRAISVAQGRAMATSLTVALPGRVVLMDQEDPFAGKPPFEGFEPTAAELAQAREHVRRVRASDIQFAAPRNLGIDAGRVRRFVKLARRDLLGRNPGDRNVHLRAFLRDFLRQRARYQLLDRVTRKAVPDERGVLYPVQFTDDSQITIRGEAFANQLAWIEYFAAALPYGHALWVKPHPASPGDLPVSRLLALAKRSENIRILHPRLHAHEILRRATAVLTVNSTLGFEALMFGVPTVTLGKSLYRGHGLTIDVATPSDLPQALWRAVQGPRLEEDAATRFIAYMIRITHPVAAIADDPGRENAARYVGAIADALAIEEPGDRQVFGS